MNVEKKEHSNSKSIDPLTNIEQAINEVKTWPDWKVKNAQLAFSEKLTRKTEGNLQNQAGI